MILCDTGPIIALHDRTDTHHVECVATLAILPAVPLVTTWPCFTEAMYLLGHKCGWPSQLALWQWIEESIIVLHSSTNDERVRMHQLMQQYVDLPMDLADASLVAAAERLKLRKVFAIDSHFRIYRPYGHDHFDVVP